METNILKYEEAIKELNENERLPVSPETKFILLKQLLQRTCQELVKEEVLQFPSLFSKIVFLSQKYNLTREFEWSLQNIRVKSNKLQKDEKIPVTEEEYISAKKIVIYFLSVVYIGRAGEGSPVFYTAGKTGEKVYDFDSIRIQVVKVDTTNEVVTGHSASRIGEIIFRYNVEKVNDIFNPTIKRLWEGAQVNLIDCSSELNTNYLIPRFIVLEPDYLLDASALAECFQVYGKSSLHYFRRKFEQYANSQHILLGNLANYFHDELIFSENPAALKFHEVFVKAFRNSPFEYTSCNEIKEINSFRAFMVKAQKQFENIRRVVLNDFPVNGIDTKKCTLEPSFYCEKFGLQGRLDLLQLDEAGTDKIKIVELKSGSLPYPREDAGKISLSHEVQTTIYRLIIQSVFNIPARDIVGTILYSASENPGENLRFSAPYASLEKEIINLRNLVVANEHDLYVGGEQTVEKLFSYLFKLKHIKNLPPFFTDRLINIEEVLFKATNLEKKYFYRFISFISRELYLQKVGNEGYEINTGVSALWTSGFPERKDSCELIAGLEILEIDDSGNDMKILFRRDTDAGFVNFREGEICILYPHESEDDTVLSNQILKGTIASIDSVHVLVRFRYKQKNKDYLHKYKYWVIEHDKLDHTYNNMFKSLFAFLASSPEKRSLLLGLKEPQTSYNDEEEIYKEPSLSEKQEQVISKAIQANEYFLIAGPPGTGKTSVFARKLMEIFYSSPDTNILVMAYTNRAVDELCEAINAAFGCKKGECDNYIRIGSELSCNSLYRHRLLQNIAAMVKSRDELRTIMSSQRIYAGTLAAITGKPELFDIKKFNIAIIDEASQILEPQIIGLLPKFDKFIMIGDHKQLSTITLQDEIKSKTTDPDLNNIELTDCRESYFERLYRICKNNGWEHAFDTLVYQGRMHDSIAAFPNQYFYGNKLKPIFHWQQTPLAIRKYNENNKFQKLVATERVAFISGNTGSYIPVNDKINVPEAETVVSICKAIIEIYKINKRPFSADTSLGVIAPYRNQIALIKHQLELTGIPELKNIMVDTVERYQGSQKDIIILSFCISKPYQLDFLSNLTTDGKVDRKLNVALTRAREQLFMVGNEYILKQNKIYNSLLNEIKSYSIE